VDTAGKKSKKTWLWLLAALLVIAGSLAVVAFMPEPPEFEFLAGRESIGMSIVDGNDLLPSPEVYSYRARLADVVQEAARELPSKGWTLSTQDPVNGATFTRPHKIEVMKPGYRIAGGAVKPIGFLVEEAISIAPGKYPRVLGTYPPDHNYVTVTVTCFREEPRPLWDRLLSLVGLGG
jgi:hypothetical protein